MSEQSWIQIESPSEYFFKEGCFITELLNDPRDQSLSIAQARVEPGVATRWHRLRETTERYFILAGQGLVEVGDQPAQQVAAGAVVIIAAGDRQRITNSGSEDLIFNAVCTPRFEVDNYIDCEDEK